MRSPPNVLVFAFFLVLAVVFTAPLSLAPHERVANDGDPLHISWILAWDAHQLVRDPIHLFDSNTFYPYPESLAFSEHLLGVALLSAPVYYVTGNALLAQNVAVLLTLALAALGMYLLARELFGRADAALVAALVYTFHAYTFTEVPRVQLLSIQWLPLTLLHLHRSFVDGGRKNAVLCAVFFTLQGLACTYYLFYTALVLAFWIPAYLIWMGEARTRLKTLVAPMVGSAMVFGILSIPYLRMVRRFDFERALEPGLDLLELVRPPGGSIWAQLWSFELPHSVAPQFFGVVALALALAGIATGVRSDDRARTILFRLSIATGLVGVVLSLGPVMTVGGRELAPGPYRLLYEHVPFFRALRNAERIGILTRFGLAVAAGAGAQAVFSRLSGRALSAAHVALAVVLPFEHFAGGQPYLTMPTGESTPEVYRWLAETEVGEPVVELPLFPREQLRRHAIYMYYSTVHWRPIVFGRTSFYPPVRGYLAWQMRSFPDEDSIALLERLGVERVVIHPDLWPPTERRDRLTRLRELSDRLEPEGRFPPLDDPVFGSEQVFRLRSPETGSPDPALCTPADPIDASSWRLSGDAVTPFEWAVDRDPKTKWRTDRQLPGMKLQVDLGAEETIAAVRITLGYPHDHFPRDLTLKARGDDDTRFERVDVRDDLATKWELVDALVNDPSESAVTLRFEPIRARRLRFWIREGKRFDYALPDWSMPELYVYRRCDPLNR